MNFPADTEVGKIYEGSQGSVFLRIEGNILVVVGAALGAHKIGTKQAFSKGDLYCETYSEIPKNKLCVRGQEVYNEHFLTNLPEKCTCDSWDFLTDGCTCGYIERERLEKENQ